MNQRELFTIDGLPKFIHRSYVTNKWTYLLENGVSVKDGERTPEMKSANYRFYREGAHADTYELVIDKKKSKH